MFDISAPETLRGEKPRLQQQVHGAIRCLHYSRCMEEVFFHWTEHFAFWRGRLYPAAPGESEVGGSIFHCKHVLGPDLAWSDGGERATLPRHAPAAFAQNKSPLPHVFGAGLRFK